MNATLQLNESIEPQNQYEDTERVKTGPAIRKLNVSEESRNPFSPGEDSEDLDRSNATLKVESTIRVSQGSLGLFQTKQEGKAEQRHSQEPSMAEFMNRNGVEQDSQALLLFLDSTLIHCQQIIQVDGDDKPMTTIRFLKRPGLSTFMREMSQVYK
jgi:hypothetical protein